MKCKNLRGGFWLKLIKVIHEEKFANPAEKLRDSQISLCVLLSFVQQIMNRKIEKIWNYSRYTQGNHQTETASSALFESAFQTPCSWILKVSYYMGSYPLSPHWILSPSRIRYASVDNLGASITFLVVNVPLFPSARWVENLNLVSPNIKKRLRQRMTRNHPLRYLAGGLDMT